MIRHEDGTVTAENAMEVMQCLLAGMKHAPKEGFSSFRLEKGLLEVRGQFQQEWGESVNWVNKPQNFRRPEAKEPEWFGREKALKLLEENDSDEFFRLHCEPGGGVIGREHPIYVLHSIEKYCLLPEWERYQSELGAQPKPYEPMEKEVEEMRCCFSDIKEAMIAKHGTVNISISCYEEEVARHVLHLIQEAKQLQSPIDLLVECESKTRGFVSDGVLNGPQKTEGLTLWQCAAFPVGSIFRSLRHEKTTGVSEMGEIEIAKNGFYERVRVSSEERNSANWELIKRGDANVNQ